MSDEGVREWLDQCVAYSEADVTAAAEAAGRAVRVTRRDGVSQTVTWDLCADRVNLEIDGGLVVRAYLG